MLIKPYGERPDDGAIQMSFTLPVVGVKIGRLAAEQLCQKMGLHDVRISHAEDIGGGLMYFVIHANTSVSVDRDGFENPSAESEIWPIDEVDRVVLERLERPLVVIGATIGEDAHTIGLDAILNAKGFAGVPGLEAYQSFSVHNLGSQVAPSIVVEAARTLGADAILVSQIITHNNAYRRTLADLAAQLRDVGLRENIVLIMGGPRINEALSCELLYDAGFGPGSSPDEVADRLARLALRKRGFNL